MRNEPDYYKKNGLSPIGAFKKGLMSEEQYKGFLIGNVIKYVIRAGSKDNAIQDLNKAKHYLEFYIEYLEKNTIKELSKPVTIDLNTDVSEVDIEKLKEIFNEELQKIKVTTEDGLKFEDTDNPNIQKLTIPEEYFDENGQLKPEKRKQILEKMGRLDAL